MSIVDLYTEELRRYAPIEYNGAVLHPLTVSDLALFYGAKPSFELMQASLPPALARLSWLNCLQVMDEEAEKTGKSTGFLASTLHVLARALRLNALRGQGGREVFPVRYYPAQPGIPIQAILVGDEKPIIFSIQQMGEVREIIAAQNGYEIPDENWNPELVRAVQYTQDRKNSGIEFDLNKLVNSVAHNARERAANVWDWPIKEFLDRQDAIDRTLHYQIYTQAEASGFIKFKHGNPFPSWKFDRKTDLPGDFVSVEELDAGANGLLGTPTDIHNKE